MRKYLKFVVLVVLTALLLWWFGRTLDWASVSSHVARANKLYLALAGGCIAIGYLFRSFRWQTLLSPLTEVSLYELFATTTMGFSAVCLLGRAGELVRPVILPLRDRRVRPSASFATIGVERICDSVAVLLLFALNLIWFRAPAGKPLAEFERMKFYGLLLLVVAFVGIAGLLVFRWRSAQAIAWIDNRLAGWKFIPARISLAVSGLLHQVAGALGVLVNLRELALTALWTFLLWTAVATATWLVFHSFGLPLGASGALFVMGGALVASIVPTPGGAAGAFEAVVAHILVFLTVEQNQAAAAAIVLHLIYFAPALIFGIYFFLRGDVNFSRLHHLLEADDVEHAVEEVTDVPALKLDQVGLDQLNVDQVALDHESSVRG